MLELHDFPCSTALRPDNARMSWLQSWDTAVFRWINLSLSNSFLDRVMPFFAWNRAFVPAVILLAIALVIKGGIRGRVFVAVASCAPCVS